MITREFLPWSEHVLPSAVRWLADRHGDVDTGTLDLESAVVVLPAARAGRRLTELLIGEAEERGQVLTPPRTVTIGGLPELLYEPRRPLAGEVLSRRVWSGALRELEPEARRTVFPDPPADDDLAGWHRLGRLIHRHHRELAGESVTFADAARSCRRAGHPREAERWEALSAARDVYRRRLRELGRSDRHYARARALDRGDVSADGLVYLLGVVEMPGVTRRMLRSAAGDQGAVTALTHAPDEGTDGFDELGCVRTEAWRDREIAIEPEQIVTRGRPPSQADAVLERLSGTGPRRAPDEITVGVPDDSLVPHLEQRFEFRGVPHRYAAGTPLPRTGPYRLLDVAARFLRERRYPDLAALLRHPAVEERLTDSAGFPGPLGAADRYHRRHLPDRLGPGLTAGAAGAGGVADRFRKLLDALVETLDLGRLRGPSRRLSEWMPEALGLLERTYGHRVLDRSRPRERELAETLTALRDSAADLHGLPREADPRCGGATALRLLLDDAGEESIPPRPGQTAVEMLGWLELHLDDAPALVITGMNEGQVPASVTSDLFLPDGLRRRLGLPHEDDRYARDVYLLSAILASREEVHLVVGRRDEEGDPRRPSRLLLATSGPALARRVRRLFAEERPGRSGEPSPGGRESETTGGSTFRAPPEPTIEIDEVPRTFGVTEFRLLLRDPYRWALEHRLGLEEVHDRDREMDGGTFGALAHDVLERFGNSDVAGSTDPRTVRRSLREILEQRAHQRFGERPLPAVRIQIRQLRERLDDFARWQARRAEEGWRIVGAEVETPSEGAPFPVDDHEVRLRGRIDRIEHHRESGRWAVLDYKTGETVDEPQRTHRKASTGEWLDLQLPLYRHLLPVLAAARPELDGITDPDTPVELGYLALSREGAALLPAGWGEGDLEAADEAARTAIRALRSGPVEFRRDRMFTYRGDPLGPLLGEDRLVSARRQEGEERMEPGEAP